MKSVRRAAVGLSLLSLAVPAAAGARNGPDPSLGNGLGRMVHGNQATFAPSAARGGFRFLPGNLAIRDGQGRVLVDLTAAEGADLSALRAKAEGQGMKVTAVDTARGTIEGFAGLDSVTALRKLAGAGTLNLSPRAETNAGSVLSQGVPFERIDKAQANGLDGSGITVAAQSDSFNTATEDASGNPLTIHAQQDVASGDLPGPGNPVNSQPVVVLNDDEPGGGLDEGRGMLQIVHDIAPKSKLCFGTADLGFETFAQNVLDLANKNGPCGADVLVDDVSYFAEPFFSDSALTDAIDAVTAKGAHYFSSVGNEGSEQGWQAPVHLLDAKKAAKAANLNLSDVPPELYSGGLQDMDPGPGTDAAQSVAISGGSIHGSDGIFDLQWDDPFDPNGTKIGDPVQSGSGTVPATETFTPTAAQVGQQFQVFADGDPSGSVDIVLSVVDPSGNTVTTVDTGTSPEVAIFTATQAGTYTIHVDGFEGDTGPFTYTIAPILAPSKVTTDFNLLFFDTDGNFLGAQADNNPLTGQPLELTAIGGIDNLQIAVSRAGTGPTPVTTLRNVLGDGAQFTEYSPTDAPSTFGHTEARGTIAVGAYDPFPPFLREPFTSAGGDLKVMFDSAGNRYPSPQTRRVPSISATDGGNTTFFVSDNVRDTDSYPNFFGTSASAPHAAGIGALVLQKNGGGRSMNTEALRSKLQASTFAHDLDPDYASGSASGLNISANGPEGKETVINRGPLFAPSQTDPNFFSVSYSGSSPLKSIQLIGDTANPTGYQGPGIAFDPRPFNGGDDLGDDGFPFTVGSTSNGLKASDITASYQEPVGSTGTFKRMTLTFKKNALKNGRAFTFGVDRDELHTALGYPAEGDSADILGGATFIPQGLAEPVGLAFVGTREDGRKFLGVMTNRLGFGWTANDGYGLINAEQATSGGRRRR